MGKWQRGVLIAFLIVFITGNLFLILKKDSKIDRAAFFEKWNAAKKEDLAQTIHTSGVIAPLEEHHFYFDSQTGVFDKFLVKEGETVASGTSLFEYRTLDIEAEAEKIEMEKEKVENQIQSLEEHIDQLEAYRDSLTFDEEEKSSEKSILSGIERDIYEKELEKNLLEQEVNKFEDQLSSLNDQSGKITVLSDVDGIVKRVREDLKNPVVTVVSSEPSVKGTFSEEEMKKVSSGMKVYVSSGSFKKRVEGILHEIREIPESEPAVEKASRYPYTVQFDPEDAEKTLIGSHVDVTVVTKEVNGAVTAPSNVLVKEKAGSFIWILNESGKIEKRKVSPGMKANGKTEIKDGLKKGEFVITNPKAIQKGEGPSFITPLKADEITKKDLKRLKKEQIWKPILKGFLSR
ncbi:efflux transporter, RND family, MFP subunit [Bacillus methanolicus PB1]|uniref:Efflux transporter, RND family, MFP subunit n=1 Tax=Bacillus methanolicus PB1 TaxID=997296 RepID=I3E1U7_BACMT|nr:efflux transporter, RND family, MFP subunit [Bacillus methanolicus PB1]